MACNSTSSDNWFPINLLYEFLRSVYLGIDEAQISQLGLWFNYIDLKKQANKQTYSISHTKNENILDKICCFWPVASLPPTGTSPPPVSTLLGSVVIFPRGSQPQPSGIGSPRRSWSSTYAHLYTVQEKNVSTLKMLLFQWSITARLHLIC